MQCVLGEGCENSKIYFKDFFIVGKTCCIIGSAPLANIADIRPFLVYEIQTLISEGYTNFITYFRPSINHCVIEILNELNQSLEIGIYIEAVWISRAYINSVTKKEQKKFKRLEGLCDRVEYIDERQTPQTMPTFCNYLASRCDLLYSVGDEFHCIYGKKNKRIIQAFKSYGRTIKIIKERDLCTKPFEKTIL